MSTRLIGGPQASIELSIAGSLVATAIATAALHGYLASEHVSHTWAHVPITVGETQQSTSDGGQSIIDSEHPGTIQVAKPVHGAAKVLSEGQLRFSGSRYARDFQAPAIDQKSVTDLVTSVISLQKQGYEGLTVTLQGQASGEDDSQDALGGLTTPSTKNAALATGRGDRTYTYIQSHHVLPASVKVVEAPGIEVAPNADGIAELQQVAQSHGYATVKDMITDWHEGKVTDSDVDGLLREDISKYESVKDTITGSRTVPGTITETFVDKKVCVIPEVAVTNVYKTSDKKDVPIPAFIPIPLIYPRRRRTSRADRERAASLARHDEMIANNPGYRRILDELLQPAQTLDSTPNTPGLYDAEIDGAMRRITTRPDRIEPIRPVETPVERAAAPVEPIRPIVPRTPQPPLRAELRGVGRGLWDAARGEWRVLGRVAAGTAILIGGLALLQSCDPIDGSHKTNRPVAVTPTDPCAGLDRVPQVVAHRTDTYVDGKLDRTGELVRG